ncbi:MAG: hypothetical protein ABIW03_03940 [Sphingomicrobium sp.]
MRINTHTADNKAIVLLADGVLIGVLSELQDECHGDDQGKWAIETAFGVQEEPIPATFASPSEAADWISTRSVGVAFDLGDQVPELR